VPDDGSRTFAVDGELSFRCMRDNDEDHAVVAGWLADDEVATHFGGRDRPRSAEALRAKYAGRIRGGPAWPTLLVRDGRPIGFLQFHALTDLDDADDAKAFGVAEPAGRYGIDLYVGTPALWGTGIGSRAIGAFIRWLFAERGAVAVYADPPVDNPRAVRAFEKAGMRKLRVLSAHEFYEGERRDCWLLVAERPVQDA
jgi:aminoglycoside 6'-N-acetyltransferase